MSKEQCLFTLNSKQQLGPRFEKRVQHADARMRPDLILVAKRNIRDDSITASIEWLVLGRSHR